MTFTRNSMNNSVSRRFVLGAGAALALLPARAMAFSASEAQALIGRAVAEITTIINSGKSEAAMLKDFEAIFTRYADVSAIGQLVLGVDGRSASDAQKAAFAEAFKVYMARKYGRRFREFIGGTVKVRGTTQVKSFYEVQTMAELRGQSPFDVVFVVADRNGKFIDMKIEGISLVKAERTEIGAMLDKRRGNLDQLIADLRTM